MFKEWHGVLRLVSRDLRRCAATPGEGGHARVSAVEGKGRKRKIEEGIALDIYY